MAALTPLGSYHGMELFYIFNNWENATLGSGPLFKPQDDSVQKVMLKYWVNFANTGNPNGSSLINWPQFNASSDCYLEIKATPNGSQCGLRTSQSDLWDNAAGYVPCISTLNIKEVKGNDLFSFYPNPAETRVFISSQNKSESIMIELYDLSGKKFNVDLKGSVMDVSGLAEGMYLLKVNQGSSSACYKLIKR